MNEPPGCEFCHVARGFAHEKHCRYADPAAAYRQRVADAGEELVKALGRIVTAYDNYRGRGVNPAPTEYAVVVEAINASRALLDRIGEEPE